jgi:hypothetical protein
MTGYNPAANDQDPILSGIRQARCRKSQADKISGP